MVRNDESINGINIEGIEFKLSQFADDATCFLSDWQSVINLFLLARTFRELAGLSLSENKTLFIWLGPWRIKERNPLNLPQSGDCFNVLGIHVGRNRDLTHKVKFYDKLDKMQLIFNMWNSRNLSLMGRILTVKALGISNMIYSMTIVDCNMKIITEAQKKIDNFVWGNGTHKTKHNSFIANYDEGGLQMIDIKSMNMALRLPWIARLLKQEKWGANINARIKHFGGLRFLLQCYYEDKYFKTIPIFYRNMLKYFSYIFKSEPALDIIWNNKDIKLMENHFICINGMKRESLLYKISSTKMASGCQSINSKSNLI